MSLLIISAVAIFILIVAWIVVRSISARERRIDAVRNRDRTPAKTNIAVIKESVEATIIYDTTAAGLEVDDDLSEEQANIIRLIFEEEHPKITLKNHKEDFWATTEPAGLN